MHAWSRVWARYIAILAGTPKRMRAIAENVVRKDAQAFIGLYEPIFAVAHGDMEGAKDVVSEWVQRAAAIITKRPDDADALTRLETALPDMRDWRVLCLANAILCGVGRAGAVRDDARGIRYGRAQFRFYGKLTPPKPVEGEWYEVQTPCWKYKETALDKGLLK